MKDAEKKLYVALSVVDGATNDHQACLLKNRDPRHVASKLMQCWLGLFRVPTEVAMDQGAEWEREFISMLEEHGLLSKVTGSYAAWQNSLAERHGALLGVAWTALIFEHKVTTREEMKNARQQYKQRTPPSADVDTLPMHWSSANRATFQTFWMMKHTPALLWDKPCPPTQK